MITRMSWIHELEALVPSGSRNKGNSSFRAGAVSIDQASADRLELTVKDGGRYSVVLYLDVKEETLVVSCTCSHYENLNICKHIWASMLAAEAGSHLKQFAEIGNPFIETEIEHYEFLGGDELGNDDEDDMVPPRNQSRQSAAKPSPVENWRSQLSDLRAITTSTGFGRVEGQRRLIYVVDVAKSLAAGGLVVQAAVCRLKKDGAWGKAALQETLIREISKLEAADQKLLALLTGSKSSINYYSYREPDSARSVHQLTPSVHDVLVPMLSETERFFLKPAPPADGLLSLKWDSGAPWHFKILIERADGNAHFAAKGVLVREDSRISLAEPLLLVPGLAFFKDHVAPFDDGDAFSWIAMLRKIGELKIPIDQISRFLEETTQFPVLPPLELPEELRMEERSLTQPPRLKIRPIEESWRFQPKLGAMVTFDYGGALIPEKQEGAAAHDASCNRLFKRDLQAELARLNRLPELGFRPTGSWQQHSWELAPSRLPAAVRILVSEGWQVDADGKLYRRAGSFQMSVASGVDWFELRGNADFEGQPIEMPQLLKAIARGEHSVRLDDGTYGLLPEEWLKRYRLVAALGNSSDGQFRFERHQVGLLDALLAEQPEVQFDEGFVRIRQEMDNFSGVQAAAEMASFQGQLRDYQREGLGWLLFLRRFGFGGCLADDMGLGKTVQVLALLDSVESSRPSLIVAPRSLIFNWKQEIARFTPARRVLDHTGMDRKNRFPDIHNHDLILTTYGTLRRDAPLLKDIHFDTIVLDEAQAIKNATTESAKATRLLKADHRLALTGTPVENRVGDLWSLFEFLNPGLLGTASVFRTQIVKKNEGAGDRENEPADESLQILSKALRPFLLRRTKAQVARQLPAKTEQTIYCELKGEQRRQYDELREHYRDVLLGRIDAVGIEKSRMQILEALLRLRQAACHPGLIDKKSGDQSSAKLDALLPQIRELIEEGHKTLIFSQFTSFLEILRRHLDKEQWTYEYLDGRTRNREARVRHFQEDDSCRLFLISLKAGGLGLNLTAADYVFLLDPWWNPAIEAQAIDRTHRIGQTRNVFAYRLIARDTVEEKILELQRTKRELADAIITADNSTLTTLSRDNLELLLS